MIDVDSMDWEKASQNGSPGLLPAIVQDATSKRVLMLGYMDPAALRSTLASGRVTFFSRSRQRQWTKGESSGNALELVSIHVDCDSDTLLVLALPVGPTCHLGSVSCFANAPGDVLADLDGVIASRERERPADSYSSRLFDAGVRAIAQKVGEEAVETALAAVAQDDDALAGEAADLLYHLIVLLRARGLSLQAVNAILARRHADMTPAGHYSAF